MLDFRINTFLTVCQTMNFTKAAEELHITQPTVSQHIHYLEDYYETSLFTYQNRQLALTGAGKILQERLLRMKNDETTIQKELHENNERIKTLSIGVTMTIGEYAISGALAGYLKANPDTNIHLHYGNTKQLLQLLDNGQISLPLSKGIIQKNFTTTKNILRKIISPFVPPPIPSNAAPRIT